MGDEPCCSDARSSTSSPCGALADLRRRTLLVLALGLSKLSATSASSLSLSCSGVARSALALVRCWGAGRLSGSSESESAASVREGTVRFLGADVEAAGACGCLVGAPACADRRGALTLVGRGAVEGVERARGAGAVEVDGWGA